MSTGRWTRAGRITGPTMAGAVGWCVFATYLMVQSSLGTPLVWNDSRVYVSMAHRPLWSPALWAGPRPPLTPLVIKVVGGASAVVTVQTAFAAVAWGALAWTVGRLVAPGWRRIAAGAVVLGFATTLPIVQWNRSELSESLSLSLLALVFATFLWTSRRPTWPRVAAATGVALAFAAVRDAQVWSVGMLALAMGVYALTRLRSHRSTALRAGTLAVGLLAVVALCEWGTLASQRTTPDTADVLFARVLPFPDRVAWFAAHGMPQQHQIDRLARETVASPTGVKVVGIDPHDPRFQPFERWLRTQSGGTYLLWLVSHPAYVVTEPLQRPERAFNFAQGDLAFYAPTTHPAASPLTRVLWPPLDELLVLAVLALYLGIVSDVWRTGPWRMLVVLTLVGLAGMVVAWHGDGQEVTRHTVEGFTQVRLGVWLLVTLGVFQLPVLRRARAGKEAVSIAPEPTAGAGAVSSSAGQQTPGP